MVSLYRPESLRCGVPGVGLSDSGSGFMAQKYNSASTQSNGRLGCFFKVCSRDLQPKAQTLDLKPETPNPGFRRV